MKLRFTNASATTPLFVSAFYTTIAASGYVETSMSQARLDRETGLKALIEAGSLVMSFISLETGDSVKSFGASAGPSYTNGTRPAANTVPLFTSIWNTSDNAPNWSDGTNWRDGAGVIT